jgi:hypothetical protein
VWCEARSFDTVQVQPGGELGSSHGLSRLWGQKAYLQQATIAVTLRHLRHYKECIQDTVE